MIESWVFAVGIIAAWANGAIIGFLYRVRWKRQSNYQVAKDRFEEQRERVMNELQKSRRVE